MRKTSGWPMMRSNFGRVTHRPPPDVRPRAQARGSQEVRGRSIAAAAPPLVRSADGRLRCRRRRGWPHVESPPTSRRSRERRRHRHAANAARPSATGSDRRASKLLCKRRLARGEQDHRPCHLIGQRPTRAEGLASHPGDLTSIQPPRPAALDGRQSSSSDVLPYRARRDTELHGRLLHADEPGSSTDRILSHTIGFCPSSAASIYTNSRLSASSSTSARLRDP